jgi:hypothetical protein
MAKGQKASDWTVRNLGGQGTVKCDSHYGRFRVRRDGEIKITWNAGGARPDEEGPLARAAREAIAAMIRPSA